MPSHKNAGRRDATLSPTRGRPPLDHQKSLQAHVIKGFPMSTQASIVTGAQRLQARALERFAGLQRLQVPHQSVLIIPKNGPRFSPPRYPVFHYSRESIGRRRDIRRQGL